ncbi:Nucleoside phosphorylase superfamily [Sesbania bispinosa]|nr:Nucleoside phosphorylase superfamily [Sesbania bispinosa]
MELDACINSTTCLSTTPKVVLVDRGTSASFYLDNAAYRTFIYNKFKVSPVDMESASVALICLQTEGAFHCYQGSSLTWPAVALLSPMRLIPSHHSPPLTPSLWSLSLFKLLSVHSKWWSV